MNPVVSIIIVHFYSRKPLINCLQSLATLSDKTNFEIIIVNNEHSKLVLPKNIKIKQAITIINSAKNLGYGAGNNLGVKQAKGQYLWFLNPDTLVRSGVIDQLVKFLNNNTKVGVVAPTILRENGLRYKIQGSTDLNPITTIFSHSFLVKFWPNNFVRRHHLLLDTNPKINRQVAAVPGSVLMIRHKLFNKVGQFDKKFFLYFEEHDLCMRVKNMGKQIYLLAKPKVVHIGGQSFAHQSSHAHFNQSRFYFYQKHFGWIAAYIVKLILDIRIN